MLGRIAVIALASLGLAAVSAWICREIIIDVYDAVVKYRRRGGTRI